MYDCHTMNTATQMSNFSSSLRWMAPEIHDPEMFGLTSAAPSCKGDVYSFAMVIWEVRRMFSHRDERDWELRLTFDSTLSRSSRGKCRSQMHVGTRKLVA